MARYSYFYQMLFSAFLMMFYFFCSCSKEQSDLTEDELVNLKQAVETSKEKPKKDTAPDKKKDADKKIEEPRNIAEAGYLKVNVITNSLKPHNEIYRDDWHFQIYAIDEQCRQSSPIYYGESAANGLMRLKLPQGLKGLPLVVYAYNDAASLRGSVDTFGLCYDLEIFIPPNCFDKAAWNLSPFGDAVWRYYKRGCMHAGEAWDPTRIDCATWGANLKTLYNTNKIHRVLRNTETMPLVTQLRLFHDAIREHQQLLIPTRSPICLAEDRHNGGSMERSEKIPIDESFVLIDDSVPPFGPTETFSDSDPVRVELATGLPMQICRVPLAQVSALRVNDILIGPKQHFYLDDRDFMGTVHDQHFPEAKLDVSLFNVRLGNGKELSHDTFDDACALTNIVQITNNEDDERDLMHSATGVTFFNLFDDRPTKIYKTSDGDAEVDDNDTWAIFFTLDQNLKRTVLAFELLGHRREDFRDVLEMRYEETTEDLFLGVRADYELNEEPVDGEQAFFLYTVHVWDESTLVSRRAIRENIANCYEAADPWTHQFFTVGNFSELENGCSVGEPCTVTDFISAVDAAELAVRSQCFSNSRSNQRFRTDDSGYWSLNTEHGVAPNLVVNPGWLGPEMTFEIYIQKFDEAVFKGPRAIAKTDLTGQLISAIPTLVEGDKVMLRSQESCCSDYKLVIPCVPAFTGVPGQAPRYNFPTVTPGTDKPKPKTKKSAITK